MKEFGQPQATTEALFLSSLFWKKSIINSWFFAWNHTYLKTDGASLPILIPWLGDGKNRENS